MTHVKPSDRRVRAQAARKIRLARVRSIRRRTITGALALFVVAWLLIAITLVSGHDPALAKRSSAPKVASTPDTTTATSTSTSTSGNGGVSSVTTSQS